MASPTSSRDARPSGLGTGLYFTVGFKEWLSNSLDNCDHRGGSWRSLAGELGCTDMQVQAWEIDQAKSGHRPTIDLLRYYEKIEGGINLDVFKRHLDSIGRMDIRTDMYEEYEKCGKPILEKHTKEHQKPSQCEDSIKRESPMPSLSHGGNCCDAMTSTTSINQSGSMEPKPRPLSDPTQRKFVQPSKPQNLQSSRSDSAVFPNSRPRAVNDVPDDFVDTRPKEEESIQQEGNFSDLRSISSVQLATHRNAKAAPLPAAEYFLISSENESDKRLCSKLYKILRRRGQVVNSMHDLQAAAVYTFFKRAKCVIIIYTKSYEEEFLNKRSTNGQLFLKIQKEYSDNGNQNKRFIPIYDNEVITMLPNALLNCEHSARDFVVGLLASPNNLRQGLHHASPSHQSPNGVPRHNLSPPSQQSSRSDNNNQQSRSPGCSSQPLIVRQSHTEPSRSNSPRIEPSRSNSPRNEPSRWFRKNRDKKT